MNLITIIFILLTIILAIAYVVLLFKIAKLNFATNNYVKSQKILKDSYEKYISLLENKNNDSDNEAFIKFLSDSREMAFEYIELVQNGLKKFVENVEPQIEYYDKWGSVVEGVVKPHDFALKKISEEFKELKKLLPEENNK